MKKLSLLLILLLLVACQPSKLERCIKANKSKVDIHEFLSNSKYSKLKVVSNPNLKIQWMDDYYRGISVEIFGENRKWSSDQKKGVFSKLEVNEDTGLPNSSETCEFINTYKEVCSTTLGDLYNALQIQSNMGGPRANRFNYQRHLDFTREHYGLSDEFIAEEQATSICNFQGIYSYTK